MTLCPSLSSLTSQSVFWNRWQVPDLTRRKRARASPWHSDLNSGFGRRFAVMISVPIQHRSDQRQALSTSSSSSGPEFPKAWNTVGQAAPTHTPSLTLPSPTHTSFPSLLASGSHHSFGHPGVTARLVTDSFHAPSPSTSVPLLRSCCLEAGPKCTSGPFTAALFPVSPYAPRPA